jgi:23S rRNA (pseudouridine1915-N3)-methyltransferase
VTKFNVFSQFAFQSLNINKPMRNTGGVKNCGSHPKWRILRQIVGLKLSIWSIGKTHEPYVRSGVEDFTTRLNRYFPAEWNIIPVPKNAGMLSAQDLRISEGKTILDWLQKDDFLVALDERGKEMDSVRLADFLQLRANESTRRLVFLIGGAYGIDAQVLRRANLVWSLSKLTFPHQLVRLILTEQLYRACTILRNEKYHHA